MKISGLILLRIKMFYITFYVKNFFLENRVTCEIMSKNVVEPERPKKKTEHARCILDK